jgi:hypothetical protein
VTVDRRTPSSKLPRARAVALLALLACLCAPAAVSASTTQFSIIQDDGTFLGHNPDRDPEAAFAEAKALGIDAVRVFVSWHGVSPNQNVRKRPAGFDVGDPNSPGYRWEMYDALVDRAKRHGVKLLFTLTPAMPFWASEEPRRCPHRIGGYAQLTLSCMWKPSPKVFAQFVKATVLRYGTTASGPFGGQVTFWSLWNEPNLEHYLWPQLKRTRHGMVDLGAARYRQLWLAGWKAIATYDPPSRNKVLFGETAAISSPMDTLYAALCLDEKGRPFKGALRRLQGCNNPKRLSIAGLALHPYNNFAVGSVYTRSHTKDSLPMGYLPRARRLLDRAARYGRVARGRPIYVTEFGFQSSPPDPFGDALSPARHAAAINEAERLFYGDPRVRSISQYELYDVPSPDDFNTGLRFADGDPKPAWAAFRMPLVTTKLKSNAIEVWGMVRPADERVRPEIAIASGVFAGVVVGRPLTNPRGYYRFTLRRSGAPKLRLRATWTAPSGELMQSRVAAPGRPIKYQKE